MSGIEAILGVVSGSAGLLSLVMQLGEGAIKLKRFCDTAKTAPDTIARVTHDLETIVWTLQQLERHRHDDRHSTALVDRCTERCESSATKLRGLVEKLETGFKTRRSMSAKVYAAFKEHDLQELTADLEQTKSSLLLSYGTQMAENRSLDRAQLDLILAQVQAGNAAVAQLGSQLISRHPSSLAYPSERIAQAGSEGQTSKEIALAGHGDDRVHRAHDSAARHKRRPPRLTFRVKLDVWSSCRRRAWDFSISVAQGCWTMQIQTNDIVPENSPIFDFCRAGDKEGMMKLVEAGQAALTDVEGPHGWDLLMTAATYQRVDVYMHLLQAMPWQVDTPLPLLTFTWSTQELNMNKGLIYDESTLESLYATFFELPSFYLDLDDAANRMHWAYVFSHCPTITMYRQLLREGVPQLSSLDARQRLGFLVHTGIPGQTILPDDIFPAVGLTLGDAEMARLSTDDGFTVLHLVVGRMLAQARPREPANTMCTPWSQYAERMLRAGAEPCSLTKTTGQEGGLTPFLAYANQNFDTFDGFRSSLRAWASIVKRSGVDIADYGMREADIWRSLSQRGHSVRPWKWSTYSEFYGLTGIHMVPEVQDWTMLLSRSLITRIYVLQQAPGAFPRNPHLPGIISWPPTTAELREGHWHMGEVKSRLADRIALDVMVCQYNEPFGSLIERTQDDTGRVLLLLSRSARRGISTRSYSEPRSSRGQGPKWHLQRTCEYRHWLPPYHMCPYDAQWRIGCVEKSAEVLQQHDMWSVNRPLDRDFHIRDCVKGIFDGGSTVHQSMDWAGNCFLAHIRTCQDNAAQRAVGIQPARALKEHIVTNQGILGCSDVDLDKLAVPVDCQPWRPRSTRTVERFRASGAGARGRNPQPR